MGTSFNPKTNVSLLSDQLLASTIRKPMSWKSSEPKVTIKVIAQAIVFHAKKTNGIVKRFQRLKTAIIGIPVVGGQRCLREAQTFGTRRRLWGHIGEANPYLNRSLSSRYRNVNCRGTNVRFVCCNVKKPTTNPPSNTRERPAKNPFENITMVWAQVITIYSGLSQFRCTS